tara:strand:+ start:362 stop:976 length:615 start_codon:yes stop_codon:yes gene_type:complete
MSKNKKINSCLKVGLVSISDRASSGTYEDKGIPALKEWFSKAILSDYEIVDKLIPDDIELIKSTLIQLTDEKKCHLILTTGGTGPAKRDITPEATIAVGTKEMPGFGEQMRQISLNFVPTAILSRQTAVIRENKNHSALILNLPGQPKAIQETLEGLRNEKGNIKIEGIFAAIPYCIDLINGPFIETDNNISKIFRPKSVLRSK